jgi:hypothetical protein
LLQQFKKLQTRHAGHMQIEQNTAHDVSMMFREEIMGRRIGAHIHPMGLKKRPHGIPDGVIVVHDMHSRRSRLLHAPSFRSPT